MYSDGKKFSTRFRCKSKLNSAALCAGSKSQPILTLQNSVQNFCQHSPIDGDMRFGESKCQAAAGVQQQHQPLKLSEFSFQTFLHRFLHFFFRQNSTIREEQISRRFAVGQFASLLLDLLTQFRKAYVIYDLQHGLTIKIQNKYIQNSIFQGIGSAQESGTLPYKFQLIFLGQLLNKLLQLLDVFLGELLQALKANGILDWFSICRNSFKGVSIIRNMQYWFPVYTLYLAQQKCSRQEKPDS